MRRVDLTCPSWHRCVLATTIRARAASTPSRALEVSTSPINSVRSRWRPHRHSQIRPEHEVAEERADSRSQARQVGNQAGPASSARRGQESQIDAVIGYQLSTSWVGQEEDLDQVLRRHPCVNLCGGKPSVAEHDLNRAKISTALDHMGGGGMAQRVGRDRGRIDPGLGRVKTNDSEG